MKKQKTLKLQFNKNTVSKLGTLHVRGGDIYVSGGHNTCPSVWCSELRTACNCDIKSVQIACDIQISLNKACNLATQLGQHTCTYDTNGNFC